MDASEKYQKLLLDKLRHCFDFPHTLHLIINDECKKGINRATADYITTVTSFCLGNGKSFIHIVAYCHTRRAVIIVVG